MGTLRSELPAPTRLDDRVRRFPAEVAHEDRAGLRLTKSQEESGVVAAICFVAFALGLFGLGLWRLAERLLS